MNCTLDHIGYITDNIVQTLEQFSLFGYKAGDIINDDTQRTRICFLKKQNETTIELVEPMRITKLCRRC